ncbi:YrhK family protein [uncultured Jannaschia sp.]|uniref:YrhK family protein n=1 Tax=uncultured Jannaschia sp. TaxID=293347 RepID=UPI00261F5100|nr:YrhK family protein [uncultured Jannaschia sp.]
MLFDKRAKDASAGSRQVHAAFGIAYTAVDFCAAIAFVAGSVLFFSEAWQATATWFFVVGSALFALKPTLRLVRELKLASMGDVEDSAKRQEG